MRAGRVILKHFGELGFPHVVQVGRNNNLRAIRPLPKHTHTGAFEILYLEKGTQIWGASGRGYLLGGGDLFLTRPDEVHSTGVHPVGKSLFYWIQIHGPTRRSPLLGLPADESEALWEGLAELPGPRLRAVAPFGPHFETLFDLAGETSTPMRRARLRQALLALLLAVLESREDADEARPWSVPVRRTVAAIRTNVHEPLTAAGLAKVGGLSESRLRACFRDEVGVPLGQYVQRVKVDRAMELLEEGRSVTETAFRLGFSSSQYFATVFKRFTFRTPSAYREAVRAEAEEAERKT